MRLVYDLPNRDGNYAKISEMSSNVSKFMTFLTGMETKIFYVALRLGTWFMTFLTGMETWSAFCVQICFHGL